MFSLLDRLLGVDAGSRIVLPAASLSDAATSDSAVAADGPASAAAASSAPGAAAAGALPKAPCHRKRWAKLLHMLGGPRIDPALLNGIAVSEAASGQQQQQGGGMMAPGSMAPGSMMKPLVFMMGPQPKPDDGDDDDDRPKPGPQPGPGPKPKPDDDDDDNDDPDGGRSGSTYAADKRAAGLDRVKAGGPVTTSSSSATSADGSMFMQVVVTSSAAAAADGSDAARPARGRPLVIFSRVRVAPRDGGDGDVDGDRDQSPLAWLNPAAIFEATVGGLLVVLVAMLAVSLLTCCCKACRRGRSCCPFASACPSKQQQQQQQGSAEFDEEAPVSAPPRFFILPRAARGPASETTPLLSAEPSTPLDDHCESGHAAAGGQLVLVTQHVPGHVMVNPLHAAGGYVPPPPTASSSLEYR